MSPDQRPPSTPAAWDVSGSAHRLQEGHLCLLYQACGPWPSRGDEVMWMRSLLWPPRQTCWLVTAAVQCAAFKQQAST